RVDALYKLINTFQSSSTDNKQDESISDEDQSLETIIIEKQEENEIKKIVKEKKKKSKQNHHSFICNDLTKINLNLSKKFFLDRTSIFDLKLFQKNIPIGNKQFWLNDTQPMIFDLLFHNQSIENNQNDQQQEPEQLINVLNKLSPV
ncbi:unnamed protein product, partial [Rotaria sp. Silwood1]